MKALTIRLLSFVKQYEKLTEGENLTIGFGAMMPLTSFLSHSFRTVARTVPVIVSLSVLYLADMAVRLLSLTGYGHSGMLESRMLAKMSSAMEKPHFPHPCPLFLLPSPSQPATALRYASCWRYLLSSDAVDEVLIYLFHAFVYEAFISAFHPLSFLRRYLA